MNFIRKITQKENSIGQGPALVKKNSLMMQKQLSINPKQDKISSMPIME